jgi:hypothetical protein
VDCVFGEPSHLGSFAWIASQVPIIKDLRMGGKLASEKGLPADIEVS